jgi:hypothetical protein
MFIIYFYNISWRLGLLCMKDLKVGSSVTRLGCGRKAISQAENVLRTLKTHKISQRLSNK